MKTIKKTAAVAFAALTALSLSTTAFAEQASVSNADETKTSTVTLTATKDTEYVISIPSGAQTIELSNGATADLGQVQFVSGAIESTKKITVAADCDGKLELGGASESIYAEYSLDKTVWEFTAPSTAQTVTATVGDVSKVTAAGNYSDVVTFTVALENAE